MPSIGNIIGMVDLTVYMVWMQKWGSYSLSPYPRPGYKITFCELSYEALKQLMIRKSFSQQEEQQQWKQNIHEWGTSACLPGFTFYQKSMVDNHRIKWLYLH